MSLPHAILGILTYKPMSGYDMKSFFDKSIKNCWPAQLSQIYRDLGGLESKGFVTSHVHEQEGRPDKKVYEITEEGKQEFLSWMNKTPSSFISILRDETALRMFFGSKVEPDELIFQMKSLIKEKASALEHLNQINQIIDGSSFHDDKVFWKLSLRKGYHILEAELKWAEECIAELQVMKQQEDKP